MNNKTGQLIFQLKANITEHDRKLLGSIFDSPILEPRKAEIAGHQVTIKKLYDPNTFEPEGSEIQPLASSTDEEKELFALEAKMQRTYTLKADDDTKEAINHLYKFLRSLPESIEYVQHNRTNIINTPIQERPSLLERLIRFFSLESLRMPEIPWNVLQIKAEAAWDISQKGDGILVAVIDTGVDYTHPDLQENMWVKNGKYGYDFSAPDDDPKPDTNDVHRAHGTHCAGTIAAQGRRILGVAPKAKVMALKVLPKGEDEMCANAIRYAANNGVKVLNCSLEPAAPKKKNAVLEEAIYHAYLKGCICVFAAGNQNDDVANYSPANSDYVISVGATTKGDQWATDFSNYGKLTTLAPGVRIPSTILDGEYGPDVGTSMSCAHVSGVIALMLKTNGNLSFKQIKDIISQKGDDVPAVPGMSDKYIAAKRINALKCVEEAKDLLAVVSTPPVNNY